MPSALSRTLMSFEAMLGLVLLTAGDVALANQVTRVSGEPMCSECELRATRRLVLGTFDGDAALAGQPSSVAKDSKGTFYLTQSFDGGPPVVFDSRGHFVRRLAPQGRGPGELADALAVFIARGDSLHVLDVETGRRSVFSPTGEFVRMVPQPGIARFGLILSNGNIVLNMSSFASPTVGTPLHLFDTEGRLLRSFGGNHRFVIGENGTNPGLLARRVGPGRNGRFWTAHHIEYEFSLWSTSGELIRHYVRENDFFRPDERYRFAVSPRTPPRITTIREDSAGLVWITIEVPVAQKQWEAALGEPEMSRRGRPVYRHAMLGRLFDTLVEVLDPRTGRLLVSRRVPFYVIAATDDGEYAAYRQDEIGVPYVDIWRVRLVQP